MGILLVLAIGVSAVAALFRPWIGIASYYLLALLGPQYIWFWSFEGQRISFVVAAFTVAGLCIKCLVCGVDTSFLRTRQSLHLALLFGCVLLSYRFGHYVSLNDRSYYDPDEMILRAGKIFLFYFCAVLAIDDARKLRYFFCALLLTTLYLVYWGNVQYFTSNWSQFNAGRLMGPHVQGSIYNDENAFAMLFVTGLPFVYYAGHLFRSRVVRLALWALIPFGVHAVFLTGSRGGLLGLVVAFGFIVAQNSKKYLLALLLVPVFWAFFQMQGGPTMKERSGTIATYEGEASAESRLAAWRAGAGMIGDYPLAGVGIGSFMTALPDYADITPVIAHNTFIQYSAESGICAGICYLLVAFFFVRNCRKRSSWFLRHGDPENTRDLRVINHAAHASFIGLFVCSMFLALNYYEIYFYLLVVGNSTDRIFQQQLDALREESKEGMGTDG